MDSTHSIKRNVSFLSRMESKREGELTKRLLAGFEKVVDNVADVLSAEAFAKVLPKEIDAAEVRRDLLDVFKENCSQCFKDLLNKDDIIEKLHVVETSLGPVLKGKRFPPVSKQSPTEAAEFFTLERKLAYKKALEERVTKLEGVVAQKGVEVEESRKKAKKTADDFELIKSRFSGFSEDADTEPEEI
jgi:hypothetical protein